MKIGENSVFNWLAIESQRESSLRVATTKRELSLRFVCGGKSGRKNKEGARKERFFVVFFF